MTAQRTVTAMREQMMLHLSLSPSAAQSEEQITAFVRRVADLSLTASEVLQCINMRPEQEVELHLVRSRARARRPRPQARRARRSGRAPRPRSAAGRACVARAQIVDELDKRLGEGGKLRLLDAIKACLDPGLRWQEEKAEDGEAGGGDESGVAGAGGPAAPSRFAQSDTGRRAAGGR